MPAPPSVSSPFKFLDAYTAADQSRFFGRHAEQKRLVELLFRSRLVLVYGPSGTGKTSLVQCGLAKAIPASDYFLVSIRRRGDLRQTLVTILSGMLEETALTDPVALVAECIRYALRPIYLVFDQLEELFISGTAEEQQWFAGFLKAIEHSSIACKVILVTREDFLAFLYTYEEQLPGLFDFRMRVEPMSERNLEEVIVGTFSQIDAVRLVEEPRTVRLILENNRSSANSFQLPYLQVYLDRLWRKENEKDPEPPVWITPALVEEVGRIDDVLELFLAEQKKFVTDLLAPDEQPAVSLVLETFVTYEGTRREHRLASLEEATRLPVALLLRILSELERTRLVRPDEGTYELAHDSLAKVIDKGRSAEQRQINDIIRRLKDAYREYMEKNQAEDLLLSSRRLSEIRLYEKAVHDELDRSLEKPESDAKWAYIEASRAFQKRLQRRELEEQQRKNARLKRTIAIVSVFLAVALASVWFAVNQWGKTNHTRIVLQAEEMDPVQALVTVAGVYEQDPNELNRKALYNQFYNHRLYASKLELESMPIREADFSEDGRYVLTTTEGNLVHRWDRSQQNLKADSLEIPGVYLSVELAPDNRRVLALTEPGNVFLADFGDKTLKAIGADPTVFFAEFSKDGQTILTVNGEGTVTLWTQNGSKAEVLTALPPMELAAYSLDGSMIVGSPKLKVGQENKELSNQILLWDPLGKQLLDSIRLPNGVIWAEAIEDGRLLLVGTEDGRVFQWDRRTRQIRPLQQPGGDFQFPNLKLSRDGHTLAAGVGQAIYWWNSDGKLVDKLKVDQLLQSIEISPDGRMMLTVAGTEVELWDQDKQSKGVLSHSTTVSTVAFAPDGKSILTRTEDGKVFLWNWQDDRLLELPHEEIVLDVSVSADDQTMVTLTVEDQVVFWNRAGQPIDSVVAPFGTVGVLVSVDARHLLLDIPDKNAVVWNRTQRRMKSLAGEFVTASADRSTFLTRTKTGKGYLWNFEGERIDSLPMNLNGHLIYLSENGQEAVIRSLRSTGGKMHIWSRKNRRLMPLPGNHLQATISPDGTSVYALTKGNNDTLSGWNQQGQSFLSQSLQSGRFTAGYVIRSFALSPSGQQALITQEAENQAFLWNVKAKSFSLLTHSKEVENAEFSPDGTLIATFQGDGKSFWWGADGKRLLDWRGTVDQFSFSKSGALYSAIQGHRVLVWPGPDFITEWLDQHIPKAERQTILAGVKKQYRLQTSFWEAIWQSFRE
ncbi:NACHT and WD repeat domain-containing protein [Larkinella sp. C7]|jgi:WD40 repeat protein|uniref:NACHT and WD repeat domain-containing protein n=1 Tax=Larkinella sp. C7 TaxID=2576607 RepID=UPI0011111B15|nr:NACHT and WD repeat domain-containing protein [Larkinella sp. C7]